MSFAVRIVDHVPDEMTDGVNTVGLLYRYFCQYNMQGIEVCVNVVTHHDHLHSPTLDR